MTDKRVNLALLILITLLALFLYWPAFSGRAIWDDKYFWFIDPVMDQNFSFITIWRDFNWPLSVTIQKILFSWWGKDYFNYHLLNFCLHVLNGFLLYRTLKIFNVPYAILGFALFLLNPANVISVAWMIQLKTLLCFFFALLSLMTFKQSENEPKKIILSYFFYFLSLLSKSASVPLGIIFFFWGLKNNSWKKSLIFLPFLLLSIFSTYRLIKSPVTESAIQKIVLKPSTISATTHSAPQVQHQMTKEPETPKTMPSPKPKVGESSLFSFKRFLPSLHYYFWQAILPMKNHPVHTPAAPPVELIHFIHLIFLGLLIYLNWNKTSLWAFVCGHFMLLPYLGFINAPFMNVTWVSDQHLYLVIPFFIVFWLFLLDKAPTKKNIKIIFSILLLLLFSAKLRESSSFYKNEISFFKSSLDEEVLNVPITYNLAVAYSLVGNKAKAIETLTTIIKLSQSYPELKNEEYFPAVVELFFQLQGENK